MTKLTLALLGTLALSGAAVAAEQTGASMTSPGHEMQEKGSRAGNPGASGYAPGHAMKAGTTGSTNGPGAASGPHPGSTSGSAGSATRR